jgi:hypothetical protein
MLVKSHGFEVLAVRGNCSISPLLVHQATDDRLLSRYSKAKRSRVLLWNGRVYLKRLHFGFEELSGMNSLLQSCFNLCGTVASLR